VGYYATKGAGFVLLGSGGIVFGPEDSMIYDNNALSVALATSLPLLIYLYRTSAQFWVRVSCFVVAILVIITIIGTYSRGGFLALLAIGGLLAPRLGMSPRSARSWAGDFDMANSSRFGIVIRDWLLGCHITPPITSISRFWASTDLWVWPYIC
jgi:hypothetical protein